MAHLFLWLKVKGMMGRMGRDAAVPRPLLSPKEPVKTLKYNKIQAKYYQEIGLFEECLSDAARRRPYPSGPYTHSDRIPIRHTFRTGIPTEQDIYAEWFFKP